MLLKSPSASFIREGRIIVSRCFSKVSREFLSVEFSISNYAIPCITSSRWILFCKIRKLGSCKSIRVKDYLTTNNNVSSSEIESYLVNNFVSNLKVARFSVRISYKIL